MQYPFWIFERSFGGIGVAVSPMNGAKQGNWPAGPSSPMSLEACNALVAACTASDARGPALMVLLVGGAGNGKSKLAADVVAGIRGTRRGQRSSFAQRRYEFDLPNGRAIRVINDATIPPKDRHAAPLRRDLVDALRNGEHFLGCVNRGVLISEVGKTVPTGENTLDQVASSITSWLLDGRPPSGNSEGINCLLVPDDVPDAGHYRYGKVILDAKVVAVVHVVYMDRASLLEEWEAAPDADSAATPLPLGKIKTLALLGKLRASRASAFEACVTQLAVKFGEDLEAVEFDPIRANALSLSRPEAARGWCSIMRGAEILSGTHFSYRELWALGSHSLVGPVASDDFLALTEHIEKQVAVAQNGPEADKLTALLGLGNLRTHMLLFDAGTAARGTGSALSKGGFAGAQFLWPSTTSDALRAVQFADPLRQFGATDGEEASKLGILLNGISEGRLPGAALAKEEPGIGQYWSPLDAAIEEVIRDAIQPGDDALPLKARSEILAWYGRYMHRLVALARGWPAYVSVVDEWQNAWAEAHRGRRLSREIETAILDILAPEDEGGRSSYFTFLQSRVTSGAGSGPKIRLELPRNKLEISARTEGDRIDIGVVLPSGSEDAPAGLATLDFHFMREALARRDGHGFTDSLLLIEPRIERLRAAMVAAQFAAEEGRNRFMFSDRTFSEVR